MTVKQDKKKNTLLTVKGLVKKNRALVLSYDVMKKLKAMAHEVSINTQNVDKNVINFVALNFKWRHKL